MLLEQFKGIFKLGNPNVIDFGAPPVKNRPNYYALFILMRNNILNFQGDEWFNFDTGIGGAGVQSLSTGPLQFIYTANSTTLGTVLAYNDGIINVPQLTISADQPIVQACIKILNVVGLVGGKYPAKTYKLAVYKNGVKLYTVRSLLWGSQWNLGDQPNYQLIDRQYQGSGLPNS